MRKVLSQEIIDEVKSGRDAGQSYAKIADALGITRSAVAGIVYRHCKAPPATDIEVDLPDEFYTLRIEHEHGTKTMMLGKLKERIDGGAIYRAVFDDPDERRHHSYAFNRCKVVLNFWPDTTISFDDVDVRIRPCHRRKYPIEIRKSAPPPAVEEIAAVKAVLALSREEQERALDLHDAAIEALWEPFIQQIEADIDARKGHL